jgi:hypothetical protein
LTKPAKKKRSTPRTVSAPKKTARAASIDDDKFFCKTWLQRQGQIAWQKQAKRDSKEFFASACG